MNKDQQVLRIGSEMDSSALEVVIDFAKKTPDQIRRLDPEEMEGCTRALYHLITLHLNQHQELLDEHQMLALIRQSHYVFRASSLLQRR